jgi:hypothetical protein
MVRGNRGPLFLLAVILLVPLLASLTITALLISANKLWVLDTAGAVAIGFTSTLGFVGLHHLFSRFERFRVNSKRLSLVTDQFVWGLISFVLMMVAFEFLNRAMYRTGVFQLHTEKVWGVFSAADSISLAILCVLLIVVLGYPLFFPAPRNVGALKEQLAIVASLSVFLSILFVLASLFIWYVLYRLYRIEGGYPPSPELQQTPILLPTALQNDWWVGITFGAVLIATGIYFGMTHILRRVGSHLPSSIRILSLDLVRMLLLVLAVLPPLVSGMAFSAVVDAKTARLPLGTLLIFGLFMYGGFMVWALTIKLVHKISWRGAIVLLFFSFLYAWLITVLWATLIELVKTRWAVDRSVFEALLNMAVAVVLILVVYSFLYRRTWGRGLSDQWPGERANYIIFAIILGVLVVSVPNNQHLKAWLVSLTILTLLFFPAFLMRRRLSAWVMIRASLGSTEDLQEQLEDDEVDVASLYGPYELIARLEVERRKGTEDALTILSDKVQAIREKAGVTATETFIDISDLTSYWAGARRRR